MGDQKSGTAVGIRDVTRYVAGKEVIHDVVTPARTADKEASRMLTVNASESRAASKRR
jgi:hypothetical protein